MAEESDLQAALRALEAERDIYARVLELARKQRELAEGGKAGELLGVLAEKGKLTEEAARVAEASRGLKAEWSARARELGAEERARGQGLLDEITRILGEVLAEEDACQKILGGRRDGTMEEMLRVQKGRRAARAYGERPPQDPRFKDERK